MKLPKIPYWYLWLGPTACFCLGFALNAIACGVNGSSMPVQVPAGFGSIDPRDWIHHAMTAKTHLKILCDWIAINGVGIASPGDFLEWFCDLTQVPCWVAAVALYFKDAQK